jgi:hypothetical protein
MYAGELPAPRWLRLWTTGFLAVLVGFLGLYSYFQSAEDRLRRFAIWLLLTSGVLLATKVLAGWTVDIQLAGFFKFLLARGDPGVDQVTLLAAIVFTGEAVLLILSGRNQIDRDSRVSSSSQPELRSFCQHVAGHWWSIGADPNSVSFATIEPDHTTGTLIVNGRAYALDGHVWATWDTTASSIDLQRKKLLYIWEGRHSYREEQHPGKPPESHDGSQRHGFGEISFYDSTGVGRFYDIAVTDEKRIIEKESTWERCSSKKEVCIMEGSDWNRIGSLVQKKLHEYRK